MESKRSMAHPAAAGRCRLPVARLLALRPLVVWLGLASSLLAAAPSPFEAHTSEEVRRLAVRGIPLDKLTPTARQQVDAVLGNTTLFRRLPVRVVECDPEMYLFLLRHPDVVVNVWRVLGVTQLEARQTAPGRFAISDHAGTSGTLEILHQTHDTHVALADGRYEGPLSVRPIKGKCLLVIRSGYVQENDGRYYVTTRLDSFLSLEPGGAELLARVLQPLVGKVADNNFTQSVSFLGSLSRTAEVNPRGVERLSKKLQDVPATSREMLSAITQRLGAEYENSAAAREAEAENTPGTMPQKPQARATPVESTQLADRPHATQE